MLDREIRWAMSHVLRSPARLRALCALKPRGGIDFARFLAVVVPLATRILGEIEARARSIPDERLRHEALASIESKAYHVAGASILATFLPRDVREQYVRIVAPLESIYDYLDNLCDRHPDVPADAYPVLHRALLNAVDPTTPLEAYYASGPSGDDGGYLRSLVRDVRDALARVPGHEALVPYFREATAFYTDLQTFKHYPARSREAACIAWYERHRERFTDLTWWEFASAAGSQFQIYAPLYALFRDERGQIGETYDAYFPALSALHVLLDYFIDRREDAEHGELNFVDCYSGSDDLRMRARAFAIRARTGFARLAHPRVHDFVLRVMSLFYLTHPKVFDQGLNAEAQLLLEALGTVGAAGA